MGLNLIQKILKSSCTGNSLEPRSFVRIQPSRILTHDNTAAVINKVKPLKNFSVKNSSQLVFAVDHDIQNKSEINLKKYDTIKSFAAKYNVDYYPPGTGIGHQVMIEEGYAFPGTLTVASDSHSNMYGALACLGTPVVRTDAASIWATGTTWWQIPPFAKVELTGSLPKGLCGKDVIIALCGMFNNDEVLNYAIEFTGSGVASLKMDDRLTISNMTTEWGALAGVFPMDKVLFDWLKEQARNLKITKGKPHPRLNSKTIAALNKMEADTDAIYSKTFTLNLSSLSPLVAGPNAVKKLTPASVLEHKRIKINKAYLLSCTNARTSDIVDAANVLRGRTIAPGVEFYLSASSLNVQKETEASGHWQTLLNAGARPLPSGCGPCIGLGIGLLKDGEVGISATNRNFKGRMGSKTAEAYLASPSVVAESAAKGYIASHLLFGGAFPVEVSSSILEESDNKFVPATLVEGFQGELNGEILFCDADNLNTDGIYPGKYTYMDDITPERMKSIVMENYDAEFAKVVKSGDILVSGSAFGSGSSREQAATCILSVGIKLVLAHSFSETFKRNAVNNGLICLEASKLVSHLRSLKFKGKSVKTKLLIKVDLIKGKIYLNDLEFSIPPLGEAAQELVLSGGLEGWIQKQLNNKSD